MRKRYCIFQSKHYFAYRESVEKRNFEISNIKCCRIDRENSFSCDSSEKSSWSSRKLKSSRIDSSWVKSQLYRSAYIYIYMYLDDNRTLKWDTMCMKLYCSPESVGQFGPSADQAIVCHTYHRRHQTHWHRLQEFLAECIPRIHSNLPCQIKSFRFIIIRPTVRFTYYSEHP